MGMEGYRFSTSATRNIQPGGNLCLCSVSMICDESLMYDGILGRYFCSLISRKTEAAYVGVPIVALMGRSFIGGYVLCSLGFANGQYT